MDVDRHYSHHDPPPSHPCLVPILSLSETWSSTLKPWVLLLINFECHCFYPGNSNNVIDILLTEQLLKITNADNVHCHCGLCNQTITLNNGKCTRGGRPTICRNYFNYLENLLLSISPSKHDQFKIRKNFHDIHKVYL